jgi:hypothetical protein
MVSRSILAGLILLAINNAAFGKTFNKLVRAGVTTELHDYTSWDRHTCKVNGGILKVLTKPQHGKLISQKTTRVFTAVRDAQENFIQSKCTGKAYPAFVVYYRSAPEFRGVDSFSLQLTFGSGNSYVDDYNITVQ